MLHNTNTITLRKAPGFLLVLLLLVSLYAGAENIAYEVIRTDISPKTKNIAVHRDRFGFLWVGTESGVDCYDGNGMSVFDRNSSTIRPVSGQSVSSFFEDDDNVWIGADKGLFVYNRPANTTVRFPFTTKYGVPVSSQIGKILKASDNFIWIGTLGQGLFFYDKSKSTLTQDSSHGSFYTDLTIGADGNVYAASINGVIQSFSPQGTLTASYRIPDFVNEKHNIYLSASGKKIWIGIGNNIYWIDPEKNEISKVNTPGLAGNINSFFSRPDGSLLLSSEEGMWTYSTIHDTFQPVALQRFNRNRINSRIMSMHVDFDGSIIVIPSSGPLEVVNTKPIAVRLEALTIDGRNPEQNTVRALVMDKDGKSVWVGTDRGLDMYDINSRRFSGAPVPALDNISVSSLALCGSDLWVGTTGKGLYKYNTQNKTLSHYTYDENKAYSVISNDINNVGVTEKGEIFILTDWGVCRYDPSTDKFPQLPEFEQNTRAIAISEDAKGGVWVSSVNNGMYYRFPGATRFTRMWDGDMIASTPIMMMDLDKNGRLWAATYNSDIFVLDDEENYFKRIHSPALNNTSSSFMVSDNESHIWLGTDKILAELSEPDILRQYNFSRQASQFVLGSPVSILPDGKIAVGGRNGLVVFEPSKFKQYGTKPKVYPLSLSFPNVDDNENKMTNGNGNILLLEKQNVELPYNMNTFTIRFATSRPLIESEVKYDYMLKGVDKNWVVGSSSPEVTYNNLTTGDYEFLLRPHGIKDAEPTKMSVSILPPWYRTDWAIMGYLVLFVISIIMLVNLGRVLMKRRFARRVNEIQVIKERENFEAKTRYFVDLVHEIRTPLMLISLPLEQLANENDSADGAQKRKDSTNKYIKSMQQNIDYLLGITNQLLDFRRVENQNEIRLNLTRCNISELLRKICHRFDEPMKVSKKVITLDLPADDIIASIDVDKTERLIMNLIGNGMKYATTYVAVALKTENEEIKIVVTDDGLGVPNEDKGRIFDMYYQIGNDKVAASLGTGLGLAYAKLIANAHKGDIEVSDNPEGHGAVFTITIPKVGSLELEPQEADIKSEDKDDKIDIPFNQDVAVLVVEDNDELRGIISESLGRYYTVVTAPDGELALKVLESNNIDIIVSDVMMAGMNGLELCRQVKNDIRYSHIPFIILTAMTTSQAHEEGLRCGADVYLEKPFPMKQLVLQIDNLLRTRQLIYQKMSSDNMHESQPMPGPGLNKMDAEFIEKMNNLITDAIANEEFSIKQLAEDLNMSRSSFYRKITSLTGMSPNDYIKNYRLNYAAKLLCEGYRVIEVAERVGFTSSSYFAKCFREKFGVLPSDYVDSMTSSAEPNDRQ